MKMKIKLIFVVAISLAICNCATLSNKDLNNSISQRVRAECQEPPDSESCDYEQLDRFYYDHVENKCKPFIFGGCDGNSNHFERIENCLEYCQKSPEDVCRQPKVHGPCRANFYVYGYDAAQKKCVEFSYGGCKGNDNNFITFEDCQNFCDGV